ncbi:MAG: hypothetical protein WCE51_02560 [Chthoniobacterales bacterium]|jgi:hypothetical protein
MQALGALAEIIWHGLLFESFLSVWWLIVTGLLVDLPFVLYFRDSESAQVNQLCRETFFAGYIVENSDSTDSERYNDHQVSAETPPTSPSRGGEV